MVRLATAALAALSVLALAAGTASAQKDNEVIIDIDVGEPVMMAGEDGKAYVQIAITGFEPEAAERPPVNMALVIDRSGSMRGDRLEKAKEAALMVVDRLGADDILSVVTYDTHVEVLVPPTQVSERDHIRRRIMAISDRGSTALYAGVSKGIDSVEANMSDQRINRVILLSDGKANVGPKTPEALAELGVRAGGLGIPVTTIGLGLGYNEDIMSELALSSDGNHAFAEDGDDLHAIFHNELGDVLSVVAQDIVIEVELAPGVRPIRGINRPVSIRGNKAEIKLSQVYAKQTKRVLMEVEVPKKAARAGTTKRIADVDVRYRNLHTKKDRRVRDEVAVKFARSRKAVEKRANKDVMVEVVELLANQKRKEAIALRDKGKVREAKKVLQKNVEYLNDNASRYRSKKLRKAAGSHAQAAERVEKQDWRKARKQEVEEAAAADSGRAW